MRSQDVLGWVCLIIAAVFYYIEGYGTSKTGLFFNSMTLGFFGSSVYMQYRELKARKK
jgi:hypothetical protein